MPTVLTRLKHLMLIAAGSAGVALVGPAVMPASAASLAGSRSASATTGATSVPELRATYSTIDFPGATWTMPTGIARTAGGTKIVGTYLDSHGNDHGFLLSGGHYQTVDFPVPASTPYPSTEPMGINSRGQIVGVYHSPHGGTCSFTYDAGTFTTILPCAFPNPMYFAYGLNTSGDIVGRYVTVTASEYDYRGFLSAGGRIHNGFATTLYGINNNASPEMVGYHMDANGDRHGAIYRNLLTTGPASGGVFRTMVVNGGMSFFDVPGTSSYTIARGVNDAGLIVGEYAPPGGGFSGFLDNHGSFSRIDFPGSHFTQARGIDNRSTPIGIGRYDIVGEYEAGSAEHGFIATVTPTVSTGSARL
jgi:uncharacterized membrane protein